MNKDGQSFTLCCGEDGMLNSEKMECSVNGTVIENVDKINCDTLENQIIKKIKDINSTNIDQVKCIR